MLVKTDAQPPVYFEDLLQPLVVYRKQNNLGTFSNSESNNLFYCVASVILTPELFRAHR